MFVQSVRASLFSHSLQLAGYSCFQLFADVLKPIISAILQLQP